MKILIEDANGHSKMASLHRFADCSCGFYGFPQIFTQTKTKHCFFFLHFEIFITRSPIQLQKKKKKHGNFCITFPILMVPFVYKNINFTISKNIFNGSRLHISFSFSRILKLKLHLLPRRRRKKKRVPFFF